MHPQVMMKNVLTFKELLKNMDSNKKMYSKLLPLLKIHPSLSMKPYNLFHPQEMKELMLMLKMSSHGLHSLKILILNSLMFSQSLLLLMIQH
jgi:hypothetical protein